MKIFREGYIRSQQSRWAIGGACIGYVAGGLALRSSSLFSNHMLMEAATSSSFLFGGVVGFGHFCRCERVRQRKFREIGSEIFHLNENVRSNDNQILLQVEEVIRDLRSSRSVFVDTLRLSELERQVEALAKEVGALQSLYTAFESSCGAHQPEEGSRLVYIPITAKRKVAWKVQESVARDLLQPSSPLKYMWLIAGLGLGCGLACALDPLSAATKGWFDIFIPTSLFVWYLCSRVNQERARVWQCDFDLVVKDKERVKASLQMYCLVWNQQKISALTRLAEITEQIRSAV